MSQPLKFSKIFFSVKIVSALVSGVVEVYGHINRSEVRKNVLELKINDEPVRIPQKVRNIISEVMNEMKLSPEEQALVKPFTIRGLELKAFGYSRTEPGAFLGVPESFYFENYAYVVPANFSYTIEGAEFPPNTSVSQALKQSSFLSENAKKFGVAREIYESRHANIFVMAFTPALLSTVLFSVLLLAQSCKKCLIKLYPVGYSFLTIPLETLLFFYVRNKLRVHSEGKADFEAAGLGLSYIEGGIEYYEKMMDRYKTLKKLNKEFPFDSEGDIDTSGYKPQHMSLLRRITYLRHLMRAEQTKSKKPRVWSYMFL